MRWVGTSWKMNKTLGEARDYASGLAAALGERPELTRGVQPFVIPPHTAISAVAEELGRAGLPQGPAGGASSGVLVGAQNAHWEDAGAWTGEVSVPQAVDAGAGLIEIGHSERREHFGETPGTTGKKVAAALRHGAVPLLCVGEPAEVRDAGGSAAHILEQASAALDGLTEEQLGRVLIAYEPVWAIGESGRPATVEELAGPFAALRGAYPGAAGLLYGGSVNGQNAEQLLAMDDVDGLFIGRAAWQLEGYLQILELAARLPEHPDHI